MREEAESCGVTNMKSSCLFWFGWLSGVAGWALSSCVNAGMLANDASNKYK
jgi:hypothetical protein